MRVQHQGDKRALTHCIAVNKSILQLDYIWLSKLQSLCPPAMSHQTHVSDTSHYPDLALDECPPSSTFFNQILQALELDRFHSYRSTGLAVVSDRNSSKCTTSEANVNRHCKWRNHKRMGQKLTQYQSCNIVLGAAIMGQSDNQLTGLSGCNT